MILYLEEYVQWYVRQIISQFWEPASKVEAYSKALAKSNSGSKGKVKVSAKKK